MSGGELTAYVVAATQVFLVVSLPPLAAAMIVGLVVAIFQAATQIQDGTLPQIFKLFAAFAVLIALSPLLVGAVVDLGERVFTDFPAVVR